MNDARERLRKAGYADLLARLDRARRMNPAKLTQEQVNQRIGQIMDGYHTLVIPAQMSGLYRARKNVGDVPWQFASDLWYPPATAVRNRGRFNDPGSPVLYACNTATGAVFEIRPNVGDVITILIARAKSKVVELACAHIGLERSLAPELGVAPGRIARRNPRFQAMLRYYGISTRWLAVDEFLSEMATTLFPSEREQDSYKITNAIGRILFTMPGVQALKYPSVATRLKSLNVCLQPNIADEHFTPSEAWMIELEDSLPQLPTVEERGPFYRTTFIRKSEAIEPDGRIRWSEILQNVQPEDIAHLVAYRPRLPNFSANQRGEGRKK